MATEKRFYLVSNVHTKKEHLVLAESSARAIARIVANTYASHPVGAVEMYEKTKAGVAVLPEPETEGKQAATE